MTWTTATAAVVVGLVLSSRAVRSRTGPWLLDLHRYLGGISVVFLLAHLGTLWADSFAEFGPRELFVPGASEWRPEAIAWGIIAAYLLIAVGVSSLLRSRIGKRLWRVIHLLSFAAMLGGSYHAWLAGSDVKNPVTWAIAGIGSLFVLGLISMRMQRKDPDDPGPTGLSENRAILEEMRRRLEELPIPEATAQPQISVTPNPALPRRAPITDDLRGIERVPTAPLGDQPIGFGAVPLPTSEPEVGDWAEPSTADPFRAAATPAEASPSADGDTWADDGADLFENLAADPFENLGVTPARDDGFPERPPLGDSPDLFATAADTEPPSSLPANPFESARPVVPVIEEPTPSAAPTGPPPLPDAIDPVTGEPDEAAYTEWLKEWLSYAERYGDEAPEDPARV